MSDAPPPPSALRVVALVVGVGTRRFWNTAVAGRLARAKAPSTQRTGTPNKSRGTLFILAFALFGIGFQSCRMAATTVIQGAPAPIEDERSISAGVHRCLTSADHSMRWLEPRGRAPNPDAERALRGCVYRALERDDVPVKDRDDLVDGTVDLFESHRLEWFRATPTRAVLPFPNASLWPDNVGDPSLLDLLSLIAVACSALLLLFGISIEREDLGKADGMLESLYQLPASVAALHLALMLRRATVSFMLWGFVFPFWLGIAICAGFGWWSPWLALAVCVHLGLVVGASQIVIETWARLRVRPSVVRNFQAIGAVVAMLPYAGFSIVATKPAVAGAWSGRAHLAAIARWSPVLGVGRLFDRATLLPALVALTLSTAIVVCTALFTVDRMLAHGLVSSSGNLTGTRV
ncbi:MAG: hypothetical protein ACHREM_21055, partial [Polyangiales bacterium]